MRNYLYVVLIFSIHGVFACNFEKQEGILGNDYRLVGNDISDHDSSGGVKQVSPGVELTDTDGTSFIVKDSESLLRFKTFDEPIPSSATNGLLQFVLEYNDPRSFIFRPSAKLTGPIPDTIQIGIDTIEVTQIMSQAQAGETKRLKFQPTDKEAIVFIKEGRHYIPIVRGLSLPAGQYSNLEITFRKTGILTDNSVEYPLRLHSLKVRYKEKFALTAGKITTLHAIPVQEFAKGKGRSRISDNSKISHLSHPDKINRRNKNKFFQVFLNFKITGVTVHDPLDRVYIKMTQLSAVGQSQTILNDVPTEFELLSLRNGFVALLGHNMVPPGTYQYFQITLDGKGHVEWGDQQADLTIESDANNVLRIEGPFDLRGGRITEVFLHFDPNTSIFYTQKNGWVLDPDVTTTSVISMTPAQDSRLIEALGPMSNLVMSESDVVFQGSVLSLNPVIATNIYNKKMIYTNTRLKVVDRLRGVVPTPDNFPLRVIGGNHSGLKLEVKGMPKFRPSESFLLFLRKRNGIYSIVRGEYGKVSL